jgi:hypothetical protein
MRTFPLDHGRCWCFCQNPARSSRSACVRACVRASCSVAHGRQTEKRRNHQVGRQSGILFLKEEDADAARKGRSEGDQPVSRSGQSSQTSVVSQPALGTTASFSGLEKLQLRSFRLMRDWREGSYGVSLQLDDHKFGRL